MPTEPASKSPARIVLVDEDLEHVTRLQVYLMANGFDVRTAASGAAMDRLLRERSAHLVVLEAALAGENGLQICRRLTQRNGPSVVFLTGMTEEADRIVGLELGADDYLSKELGLRELLARFRAVLRRRDPTREQAPWEEVREFAGFSLDLTRRQLRGPGGTAAPLTRSEQSIMAAFFDRPGKVLTRETLSARIGAQSGRASERVIDTQVSRLRRKLNAHFDQGLIRTVRGSGYICDVGL